MSKNYYTCLVGIGFKSENNYRDKPLAYCPYGSCGIIYNGKDTMLKSYETFVLKKDSNGFVQCTGVYSRTTMKHISAWLKEIASNISYHTMKKCYLDNVAINAETGEIKALNGKRDFYGFQGLEA